MQSTSRCLVCKNARMEQRDYARYLDDEDEEQTASNLATERQTLIHINSSTLPKYIDVSSRHHLYFVIFLSLATLASNIIFFVPVGSPQANVWYA